MASGTVPFSAAGMRKTEFVGALETEYVAAKGKGVKVAAIQERGQDLRASGHHGLFF